jgi:DNA primase
MSDAQKLKLVYTKWLEIVHTYEQTPKKVYFKGRAIDPNVVRCIDYIGYLPVEKIGEALEKLQKIFSKDELIKFSFLKDDGKRKWNYAKDGGLLFIPSYDEYNNLVTAFRVRMTKPTKDTKKWKEVELSANHILQALPFGMGYKLIRDAKEVNMFEGPPDALASRMVTKTPFIGIAGTNRVNDEYLSYLRGKTVYLYFDQDPAGLEGVQKLAQKLLLAGAFPVIMKWNPLLGADINEALINGNLEKIVKT